MGKHPQFTSYAPCQLQPGFTEFPTLFLPLIGMKLNPRFFTVRRTGLIDCNAASLNPQLNIARPLLSPLYFNPRGDIFVLRVKKNGSGITFGAGFVEWRQGTMKWQELLKSCSSCCCFGPSCCCQRKVDKNRTRTELQMIQVHFEALYPICDFFM